MAALDDPRLQAVLRRFGADPGARLGAGGEATVYALDRERVVRVLHDGEAADDLRRRQALVGELSRGPVGLPFALPEILELGDVDGRWFAVERRLAGWSVKEELERAPSQTRGPLIEAYLGAAAALGDLPLEARPSFGDLAVADPVRSATWRGYLTARADRSLLRAGPDFSGISAEALAAGLPDASEAAFVHLDAGTGNMLTDGRAITAVIDIGPSSVAGDRRLDPLAAAVYLASPQITPAASSDDLRTARAWLRAAGLDDWFEPARRWLAAYWAFALDDHELHRWCREVLLGR